MNVSFDFYFKNNTEFIQHLQFQTLKYLFHDDKMRTEWKWHSFNPSTPHIWSKRLYRGHFVIVQIPEDYYFFLNFYLFTDKQAQVHTQNDAVFFIFVSQKWHYLSVFLISWIVTWSLFVQIVAAGSRFLGNHWYKKTVFFCVEYTSQNWFFFNFWQ